MNIEIIKSDVKKKEVFLYFPSIEEQLFLNNKENDKSEFLNEFYNHGDLYIVRSYPVSTSDAVSYVKELIIYLKNNGIRWVYVIGSDIGSLYAQAFSVYSGKILKRLSMLDPITRICPSKIKFFFEYLENLIPCGFPLRKQDDNYDSRSELHLIHVPSILFRTKDISDFQKKEFNFIRNRLPNVWIKEESLNLSNLNLKLAYFAKESIYFMKIPAKYPQKNL